MTGPARDADRSSWQGCPPAIAARQLAERPRTKWVSGRPGWAIETKAESAISVEALIESIRKSLDRGHFKVATRRFLMLCACGIDAPSAERAICESTLAGLKASERRRMEEAAYGWASLLTARYL